MMPMMAQWEQLAQAVVTTVEVGSIREQGLYVTSTMWSLSMWQLENSHATHIHAKNNHDAP